MREAHAITHLFYVISHISKVYSECDCDDKYTYITNITHTFIGDVYSYEVLGSRNVTLSILPNLSSKLDMDQRRAMVCGGYTHITTVCMHM